MLKPVDMGVTDNQHPSGVVVLTLRAVPAGLDALGRDPTYRLKGLLKVALRRFGLRCVRIQNADATKDRPD